MSRVLYLKVPSGKANVKNFFLSDKWNWPVIFPFFSRRKNGRTHFPTLVKVTVRAVVVSQSQIIDLSKKKKKKPRRPLYWPWIRSFFLSKWPRQTYFFFFQKIWKIAGASGHTSPQNDFFKCAITQLGIVVEQRGGRCNVLLHHRGQVLLKKKSHQNTFFLPFFHFWRGGEGHAVLLSAAWKLPLWRRKWEERGGCKRERERETISAFSPVQWNLDNWRSQVGLSAKSTRPDSHPAKFVTRFLA